MSKQAADGTREVGFALMEVLIALIVLAIGLLGLAALQAQGLRFNQEAFVRSQATILAYDLIEKMREAGVDPSRGAGDKDAMNYRFPAVQAAPGAGESCDELLGTLRNEFLCWVEAIDANLPGGFDPVNSTLTGTTVGAGDEAALFTLTLAWQDRQNPGIPVTQKWTFRID